MARARGPGVRSRRSPRRSEPGRRLRFHQVHKEDIMKKLGLAAMATLASATSALACVDPSCQPTPVPEISALQGTAALATLAAIVLLVWERRRRA